MQWIRAHAILLFSLCIVFGALLWWYFGEQVARHQENTEQCTETVALPPGAVLDPASPPSRIPPEGFARYRDEIHRFSLFYPEHFSVEEHPDAGDGFTVTFSGRGGTEGFQIFVVPYYEAEITESRFAKDVRTGFKREEQVASVDGVCAVEFLSRSLLMGRTREVWVIHNGFLYEITTFREQDSLLEEVVKSFRFL